MGLRLLLAGCLALLGLILWRAWVRRAAVQRLHRSALLDIGPAIDAPEQEAERPVKD